MTRAEIEVVFQSKLDAAHARSQNIHFLTATIRMDAADVCLEACKRARVERDAALANLADQELFDKAENIRAEAERLRWEKKEEES